jgi:hypothetical protein
MLDSRHGRPPLTPYKDQNYLPFRKGDLGSRVRQASCKRLGLTLAGTTWVE